MYIYIVNYSERGPSGHQLILRQSSMWWIRLEDFYIPTIMTYGFYCLCSMEHQWKIRSGKEL